MNKRLLAAAATLAVIASPAAAETIDFEGLSAGFYPTPYTIGSATFDAPSFYIGEIGGAGASNTACSVESSVCSGPLTVSFSEPASELSFDILGVDDANSTFSVLLSLLGGSTVSTSFTNFASSSLTIDLSAYNGIVSAQFSTNDLGGVAYDNFNFVTGAVPEPATWAMMIGGVGVTGGALRRRRANVSVRYA